jgi:spore germination protein YaaH
LFPSCRSSPVKAPEFAESGDYSGEDRDNEVSDLWTADQIPALPEDLEHLPVSSFGEIWGYLLAGREQTLMANLPLSDVAYFGAEIDSYGKLTGVPDRRKISSFPGRTHLVVTCNSRGLTHFALEPGSRTRERLIADLLEASRPFDGLQIDFELVPAQDGEAFLSFLAELREGLRGKMFTIALPARQRTLENDVYDYRKIQPLVDKILVMAYDEHWSNSAPGSIASLGWCQSVARYAQSVIEPEKLILGIPFYGRTWGNINPNRAFFYSGIQRIIEENQITEIRRENGIPSFSYEVPLRITVYYEDDISLSARFELYRGMGIGAIGFWCLGQETPTVWNLLHRF